MSMTDMMVMMVMMVNSSASRALLGLVCVHVLKCDIPLLSGLGGPKAQFCLWTFINPGY